MAERAEQAGRTYAVECYGCHEAFEAKSPRAKWCSARCKKRAQRRPAPAEAQTQTAEVSADQPAPADSSLVRSVRHDLEEAGVLDTFSGQLALQLASKMSALDATGVAGLSKELRSVMAEALGTTGGNGPDGSDDADEDDPLAAALDEVARKRAARTAG